MQNRSELSFLRTSTALLAQGLAADSLIPRAFISSTCLLITSRYWNGCLLKSYLIKRRAAVSMQYSTCGVRPMSYSPLEKIVLCSIRSSLTSLCCCIVSSLRRVLIICSTTSTSETTSSFDKGSLLVSTTSALYIAYRDVSLARECQH